MTIKLPLPLPARRAMTRLGEDLSRARRRRQLTQVSLAERSGVSPATIKRMESGDTRVSLEALARVLHVLGELPRLERLLDTAQDELGLMLMDQALPKRVRLRQHSGAL
ncbi:MAG: helix-turn-helix transcriptional regulator [Steroidobacteraceae bacterium]|uniref:helix-turn-helix domain-containing protein n=1 Tax=Thauera sp. TaxID=1905334 RepID=UPI001B47446B|nr:helix-turn-helix transcriptional regulator [Thauera sp.]MBK6351112.1 helix-turn-helix transcriptional regulator [Pseudomonadota bacterium]MBP7015198.1 helix-turn-helix transcriptional regulator [Steroidobacteraceae bacterium]MBP7049114.1 helix-turn-helix transcriptional regulator [Thauera sp.]